jgi:c(7)-type cytochrome triheme protein
MQFRLTIIALLLLFASSAQALETKNIRFPVKNAAAVIFSHDVHLQKYNNNCKICHNAIFNLKDRRHYTMAEMERTKGCGACHSGVKTFSVADGKSCINCHKGKPRNIEFKVKAGAVVFSHEAHLSKLNSDCRACHNGRIITANSGRATMAQMEKGKTCGACHNGKKAFTVAGNCGNCHKGMKPHDILFKPRGINTVTFSHKLHVEAFSCKECHTRVFPFKAGVKHNTMAQMTGGKSCGACHNGKVAFSVSGSDCSKCHVGFKPGIIVLQTEGGEVKFSHPFHLDMFKCADCHTKLFPFKAVTKVFTMANMETGKGCGACHNGKDAFSVKGDCEKCHKM